MVNVAQKAIAIVVLIALAVIAQIIVGVLGQVSYSVGNTLTATAGANSVAVQWYNIGGTNVTTILSFMSVVFLVAAVVILLDLFGLAKILRLGSQAGGRSE